MPRNFRGGVHPDDMKKLSRDKAIEVLPAPAEVVLPVSMHIGAPAVPAVAVGDAVKIGQVVAEAQAPVCAPIHATVSGTVKAIEPRPHPNGSKVTSIVIENDFEESWVELTPTDNLHTIGGEELADLCLKAGLVGLGGAAFPVHIKIKGAIGNVDTLIINGAECEPYITSDYRLMLERGEKLLAGVEIVRKALELDCAHIAIESNKRDAIDHLRKLSQLYPNIKIDVLRTKYPQGSEKHLIYAVTGREVPPGALPSAVGVVNINIATAVAIADFVETGRPLVNKVVTVSGSAVANPKNLLVRIGTPFSVLLDAAGGFLEEPHTVLAGGPMMGMAQHTVEVPVIKGTNAVLALCKDENKFDEEQICIRCGKCVGACPMNLLPNYLYSYAKANRYDELDKLHLTDCIECGACSYGCPGRLHLTQTFKTAKRELIARKKKGE